jgi:predicted kinase
MAETQTTQLDQIMQSYIDSGQYSRSELAEIRKREANKLKKSTRETSWWKGEEGFIPDEFQSNVNRPRVAEEEAVKEVKVEDANEVAEVAAQTRKAPSALYKWTYGAFGDDGSGGKDVTTTDPKELRELAVYDFKANSKAYSAQNTAGTFFDLIGQEESEKGVEEVKETDRNNPYYYGFRGNLQALGMGDNAVTDFVAKHISSMYRSLAVIGVKQADGTVAGWDVMSSGNTASDEEIEALISSAEDMPEQTDAVKQYSSRYEQIKEEEGGTMAFIVAVAENPTYIRDVALSSLGNMATSLVTSPDVAARALAAGTASGLTNMAVAKYAKHPIGKGLAFMAGFMGGMSGSMDAGQSYSQFLQEQLQKDGKDFTPENIRALLNDKEVTEYIDPNGVTALNMTGTRSEIIKNRAIRRGIAIGTIDGLSTLVAGGTVGGTTGKLTTTTQRNIKATTQAVAGGLASEIGGQTFGGQEYDAGEILTEGIAEKGVATTGVTVIPQLLKKKGKYTIGKQEFNEKAFVEEINKMDDATLAAADVKVENDNVMDGLVKNRQGDAYLDSQVNGKVTDVKDRKKIVELEKKLNKAKKEAEAEKNRDDGDTSAAEEVAKIKSDIASVVSKYSNVDGRSADVRARNKAGKEIKKSRVKIYLKDTEQFAEVSSEQLDYDPYEAFDSNKDYVSAYVSRSMSGMDLSGMTQEQIEAEANRLANEANNSDGVNVVRDADGRGKIMINREIAAAYGAMNVGSHEVLHAVMEGAIQKMEPAERKIVIKQFKDQIRTNLGQNVLDLIDTRLRIAYAKRDSKGNVIPGETTINLEETSEWFTALSDIIEDKKNNITYKDNKSFFDKIKDNVASLFNKNTPYEKLSIETGEQAFNFMKEYSKSVKAGKLSESMVEFASNNKPTEESSFSRSTVNLDEGKGELHEKIDALTNNAKTKAEFQERTKENGRFSAFENVYTGILDGKFDRIFGRNVDESIKEKQRENLADRLINYDPAKTPELSKWMYGGSGKAGNIRYSGLTALHKQWTEDQNKNKLTSIDAEEAKDVIDTTTPAPDADTEANKPDTKDVKLRDLKDFDVYLDDGFGDALAIAEVNGILDKYQNGEISLKEAKSLMNDVTLKDIRAALSESIPKIAQDPIDGKTKPTSEYESWIRSEYNEIVQSLGIRAIRKYPWFKATITGKKDYKNVTEGNVSNYVKPTQINETNKRELFRWFLEGKPGDLRERRTALIRRIAERKASIAVDNKINSDLVQLQIKLKEGTISKTEFDLKTKIITSASELSTTAKLAKDEQLSFDTVKFSKSTAVALVQEVVSNYDKNKPFGPEQALLAGYPQELVTKWEESGLFDFLDVSVKNGFVGPATEADWGIYNNLKDVFINNSTESKVMKDAMAAYAKDRIETLPPQVVRALGKGFFGMGSKRLLDAAKNKKNGTEGPYLWLAELYDDKVSQEDWDVKLPFDPEKLELLNSKSGLMLAIERIQNMELSKAEKVVEIERLQDRIDNANTHNPEFLIWFMEQSAIAMSKNPDLTLGLATQLQSATNNVFAFRAYTRIGMIKLQDGSQAPYLTKDGKPTNDKPTEKNGGDINRNHPDFNRALEYVKVSAGKLQVEVKNFWTDSRKGKKGEALIKLQNKYNTLLESYDFLTSKNGAEITAATLLEYKGEHVDPSANVMLDLFLSTIELAETLSKTPLEKYHKQVIGEHRAKYRDILINFDQSLGPKLDSNIQDDILGSTSRFGWARTFAISDQIQHYVETGKWGGIKKVIKAKTQAKLQIIGQRIRIKNAIIDTAVKFSRTANPAKGISVLDFDDTLATTKSGVRYTLPNTSGKPQPKKKVIFMAGGPGSGKSNVINQLGLKEQGFKVVNQDISLEWLMKNHGMPTDMREFTPEQASEFGKLSAQAREIALKKRIKYQGEGDGVVIDGTGASLNVMKKNIQDFKDKGYDVQMIFVETSQETALSRNKARKERSLRTGIVIKNYDSVQANKEAYKELFGERFAEVNTDNLKQGDVMPADVVNKVNDFTSGYIKGRLNAGEYATKGEELKRQGAEFDFSEFNQVVEGKTAPLFNKAMKLQEKFTSKDMFVLTARPAESNQAIFEFLQANGLKIPMENIIGLGSSASSDKALWIAGKVGEGYNDFYFADDILENVQAVSDMLEQFDVKSKVQQAKRDFVLGDPKVTKLLNEKSMNDVKDVDGLANPGVYSNVKFSKSHRAEYENTVAKNRPDLSGKEVTATIDKMFDYIDGLDVPNKRKYEQITTKWLATSNIKLPEDSYKIQQAVEIAELKKEDIFSYKNPNEIIEKYAGTIKVKPISPVGIKEFTRATGFNDPITTEYGIVEYEVEETREAQQKVRDIVNTHWGPNSNPWCITKIDKDGNLSEDAWRDWTSYGKGPKRIVFQNGKLLAMKANYEYWGKMNKHSEGPIIQVKEGNVTNTTELVVGDGGIVDPIIRETRTVSKDGNTVTTNIFENSQDGYADGTTIVENRIKGVKIKETRFDPDGSKVNTQEFNKKGKPTTSYQFNPNGKVKSVNGHLQQQAITEAGLDVNAREDADIDLTNELVVRVGDIIENNYTETETDGTTTDYFYGRALVGDQVMEIGFESKTGLDLADVTKTVNGKARLDIGKVIREVDPNVKGLPKTGAKFSKGIGKEFNDIIEQSTGVGSEKVFSDAQAKIRGNKRRFDNIVPYSVQDLMGLLYNFVGRGKAGEQHMEFFKKALIDPFARAINELNQSKQSSASDYSNLTKAFPNVKKKLNKEIEGGDYTYDQAIRVYLWNKAGFEVPGLSKRDLNALDSIVKNDPELQAFADTLGLISKKEEGYAKPGEYWLVENIASDLLSDGSIGDARSEFLAEWQQNADEMFSKENLNKIQAIYGNKFREALEDILYRMKHGTNRPTGSSRLTNNFMNWINNSTGAIMFFNIRTALLQTLSTTNYINWTDNNPLKAAAAFANQKQYWSDFAALFNSDFLKQRRSGNQRSINEAELTTAVANSDNKAKAAIAWLLQKGFLPTQIMDSFAISAGGATFYRNRVNKYIKEGMTREQAQEKAFLDFQEVTEATQQSARPDMISQQQASPLGRWLLSFQNTTMQFARIMNKAARDLAAGRGDAKHNISKIVYYGFLQSAIFAALQTAIFAALGDDEEEEFDKKKQRIVNSMVDGWLAGLGVAGKAIGTIEKSIKEYLKQKERGFNADHAQTIIQLLGFSPPIGSKVRKIYSAIQTEEFNKGVSEKRGLTLDNPTWSTWGNVIEGFTNIPLGRIANKMLNIDNALDSQNQWWERAALLLGWNTWDLGIKDPDITAVKGEIKEERKVEKKKEDIIKKEEKKQEVKEENISKEKANIELQKKEIEAGNKSPNCAAINKRGERCGTKIEKGSTYCTIHAKVEQSDGGKKTQCGKTKENGKRCKMQTSNKSGYCYYHD